MIYPENFYGYRYDQEFVKEMTTLLIISLTDLHESLNDAMVKNEPSIFIKKLIHSQFCLVLINNENLNFTSGQIKKIMTGRSAIEPSFQLVESFRKSCSDEICRLTEKLGYFEKFSHFKTSHPQRFSLHA